MMLALYLFGYVLFFGYFQTADWLEPSNDEVTMLDRLVVKATGGLLWPLVIPLRFSYVVWEDVR